MNTYGIQFIKRKRLFRKPLFWFRIVCLQNSQTIATSEMYSSLQAMDDTVKNLVKAHPMTLFAIDPE